jgi:hypothetical protein
MLLSVLPVAVFCLLLVAAGQPAWAQIDPQGCDPNKLDSGCPSDGNPCTNEVCDATTRTCKSVPRTCPIDNPCNTATCNVSTGKCDYTPKSCPSPLDNKCSVGSCDPSNGQCVYQPVTCAQDGNLCTAETCNPATGACSSGPSKTCTSDNLCSVGSCNPTSGQCEFTPITCAQDGNLCNTESCNPSTGRCESGATKFCASDNLCSAGSCDPATGNCKQTPVTCAQDGNLCTVEACNPQNGQCQSGSVKTCTQDDDLCTFESCNPSTGNCESGPRLTCAQDNNLCTVESCVPATGKCASGPTTSCTQDTDLCTTEVCDPVSGQCHSVPANPTPPGCGATICRTPGFWGTHAGVEKSNSTNITQAVITAGGGVLNVCGQRITNTTLSSHNSSVEAICVSPKGTIVLQLARQLTAAALNCVVSNGIADCSATPLYSAIFASCNAACANSGSSTSTLTDCISAIDCLNNGGTGLGNGQCQTGVCGDGVTACSDSSPCLDGTTCGGLPNNCHDQLLINTGLGFNFEPPGAAGSSNECNDANKNTCTVIGTGVTKCSL